MKYAAIFSLLSCFIIGSCKSLKEPEFRGIMNFGVRKVDLTEPIIGFNVTYYNPNNSSLTVKETEADIYLDSVYMGKFIQDVLVEVQPNSEFSIPLSGKISLGTVLKLDLKNLPDREVFLKAEGHTRVGKAGLFVTREIRYAGRHRLEEISLK